MEEDECWQQRLRVRGDFQKKRYFLGIFPKMGGGVTPFPKTFVQLPSHFWHAKFILRFLNVYFQCIRKYSDYTFDYGDMAV